MFLFWPEYCDPTPIAEVTFKIGFDTGPEGLVGTGIRGPTGGLRIQRNLYGAHWIVRLLKLSVLCMFL